MDVIGLSGVRYVVEREHPRTQGSQRQCIGRPEMGFDIGQNSGSWFCEWTIGADSQPHTQHISPGHVAISSDVHTRLLPITADEASVMASFFYTQKHDTVRAKEGRPKHPCRNSGCLHRRRLPLAALGNRSLGTRYWRYDGRPQYHDSVSYRLSICT